MHEQLPAYEHAPEYAESPPSTPVGYTLAEETYHRACALYSRSTRAKHHKRASERAAWAARSIASAVWFSALRYGFRGAAAQTGLELLSKLITALDMMFTHIDAMGCIRRNIHRRWIEYQIGGVHCELNVLERELEIEYGFECGVLKRAFEGSGAMRTLALCKSASSSASTSSSNPWLRPEQIRCVSWMTLR
ncbi:hypothetical protein AURDEDRAFT_111899 [Auricularia subglabra TFB-10046 SS5]|nr:hypothetical protein AURDEDRAFT_111899 [Auricularia subglabra TFB-10046 SS5]